MDMTYADMGHLREWAEATQTMLEKLVDFRRGAESAIDALSEATVKNREDLKKTNEACLKENMAWTLTDRMVTQMNDLLGMQQTQIRDLVRQVEKLDGALSAHLMEAGYSE
jgi:hypothetical protein